MRRKVIAFVSDVDLRYFLYTYLLLTVGALILAINFDIFLAPAKVAPGGVSGLSIIINEFTGWPQGLTMLVLNCPLVILGFYHLGRFRFLVRTLYVVLIYSLGVDFLVRWLPPTGITSDLLLNALYGGVLGGLGYGLVFRGQGTSAGTGILARVLQLKTGIPVSHPGSGPGLWLGKCALCSSHAVRVGAGHGLRPGRSQRGAYGFHCNRLASAGSPHVT